MPRRLSGGYGDKEEEVTPMKRIVSLLLVLALALACCSFAYAEGDEKVTLTAVIAQHSACPAFDDSPIWLQIAEEANVNLVWETVKSDWAQRKSILIGTNQMPDLWIGAYNLSVSDMQSNLEAFVKLNDYIENSTNVKKMFEDHPELLTPITYPDGSIYSIPAYNKDCYRKVSDCWFINKTWLDYLGKEVPDNLDDLFDCLMAFKTGDPNQNGEADEIPFVDFAEAAGDFGNGFGIVQNTDVDWFCVDDEGNLTWTANTDAFKDLMKFMRKCFENGLADPETFTQPWQDYYAYCGGETAIGGVGLAWTIEALMAKTADQYVLLPAMKDANGNQYVNISGSPTRPISFAISASCKDIDAAWRVIETAYSEKNGLQLEYGLINPPDGVGGLIANDDGTYSVVPPPADSNWDIWNISQSSFRANSYVSDETYAKIIPSEDMATKDAINNFYAPYATHEVMPSCYIFDTDTNDELSVIKTDIQSLLRTRTASWVQGEVDIDEDWDNYLQELQDLQLDRYIEIYTERYNASK